VIDRRPVREIRFEESRLRIDGGAVAHVEIVEHGDLVARGDERIDGDASDVAGSAGDKYFHNIHNPLFFRR
jgi:hypothetical protein